MAGLILTIVLGPLYALAPTTWKAPKDCTVSLVQATLDTTTGTDAMLSTSPITGATGQQQGLIWAVSNSPTGTQPITVAADVTYPLLKGQSIYSQGSWAVQIKL